jgi:hypothetical protein
MWPVEKGPLQDDQRANDAIVQVKSHSADNALVLFSGDAFNPSIMSTLTLGKQMVPVLNSIGVHCAAVGNHDLDWGVDNMSKLCQECSFPWLMANVIDKQTGAPAGACTSSAWACRPAGADWARLPCCAASQASRWAAQAAPSCWTGPARAARSRSVGSWASCCPWSVLTLEPQPAKHTAQHTTTRRRPL